MWCSLEERKQFQHESAHIVRGLCSVKWFSEGRHISNALFVELSASQCHLKKGDSQNTVDISKTWPLTQKQYKWIDRTSKGGDAFYFCIWGKAFFKIE